MTHKLKIWPEHYERVFLGTKTFEIRVNDRAFQKGDYVEMYYWDDKEARQLSIKGYEVPIDYWSIISIENNILEAKACLTFAIGDVYPIDSERVVFSLLKIKTGSKPPVTII